MEKTKIYVVDNIEGYAADIADVTEFPVSSVEQALELGESLSGDQRRGTVLGWYTNPIEAYKAALRTNINAIERLNSWVEYTDGVDQSSTENPHDCCDCWNNCEETCDCSCCDEDPEDRYNNFEDLPMEDYPSKLVYFPSTETIHLFKRKKSDKQSTYCVFITAQTVENFKRAATNKKNYSLSKKSNEKLFNQWLTFVNP